MIASVDGQIPFPDLLGKCSFFLPALSNSQATVGQRTLKCTHTWGILAPKSRWRAGYLEHWHPLSALKCPTIWLEISVIGNPLKHWNPGIWNKNPLFFLFRVCYGKIQHFWLGKTTPEGIHDVVDVVDLLLGNARSRQHVVSTSSLESRRWLSGDLCWYTSPVNFT